jgi:hypothetical protein
MKKILKLCLVLLLFFYAPLKTKAQCDSLVITDIPCDSVIAAINGLSQYTISGTDTPYSVPFAVAYLEICYPEYNADSIDLAALLHCCHPAGINYNDSTLSYCETAIYFRLLLQYALPHRSCLPSWTYNYLIAMLLPQIPVLAADSNIFLLCKDVNSCNVNCVSVCDDTIISSCDSINSTAYVYQHILAVEGISMDTNLLVNIYTTLFGYAPPYNTIISQISNCNPDDTLLTKIIFSARNMQLTDSGQYFEFDVMATDTPNNILFAESNIYITYSSVFGTNLVTNGAITASKGMAIDSPYYNVIVSDTLPNMLKLSVTHTINPTSLTNLDSVNQQLCHLKVRLSSYISGGVAFDSSLMSGQSFYQRTPAGLATPYDLVLVSGVQAPQSSFLGFNISNIVLMPSTNPTQLSFDILGTTNVNNPIADYVVAIAFNQYAINNDSVGSYLDDGDDGLGNPIYTFSYSLSSGSLIVSFKADTEYYDASNQDQSDYTIGNFTNLAHVVLYINDCDNLPMVAIDPSNSSADYGDASTNIFIPFGSVDTSFQASFNNDGTRMCILPPHVFNWSPDCTNAGSFEVVTINGQHFGDSTGTVYFNSADSPGRFISTIPQDIISWSDGQIQLLIPSQPEDKIIAASGQFYVQTADGSMDSYAENSQMSIGYANYNKRNLSPLNTDYLKAMFVYYPDSPFTFQLDSALFFNTDAVNTIKFCNANYQLLHRPALSAQYDCSRIDRFTNS